MKIKLLNKAFVFAPVLAAVSFPGVASAAVLAGWEITGIDLDGATAPNTTPYTFGATNGIAAMKISSANLTLSSTVTSSTSNNQYGFKVPGVNAQTTLTGAISAGNYFQFTIAASTGFVLNLTSIELSGESSATGSNSAAIMSSIAGFSNGNELASVTGKAGLTGGLDSDPSGFGGPISLTAPAYQGISQVTFRFYGWGSTSGSGVTALRNLSGDDLVINGTTSPVPEPSLALLSGFGALALLRRRR